MKLYPRASGSFPPWVPKTDETRIQNLVNIGFMCSNRSLNYSEKLDGQSVTFFYKRDEKVGLFKRGLYGVCSRNIWYKNKCLNNWWGMSEQLRMKVVLAQYCDYHKVSLALQGEIVGEGIQGNKYRLKGKKVYFFNVWNIDEGCYLNLEQKLEMLGSCGLSTVPICQLTFRPSIEFNYIEQADGKSRLYDTEREGLVYRDIEDDGFSFKAISNKFLLRHEK